MTEQRDSIAESCRESFRKRMDAIVDKARRRAAAMTPKEHFNARCDKSLRAGPLSCIDPEADVDWPVSADQWRSI